MMLAAIVCSATMLAAQASDTQLQGRPLAEALQILQSRGLRIVFSTRIVTPEMRVHAEPRVTAPRAMLSELLTPHGLRAVEGPASVIQIVRDKRDLRAPRAGPQREKNSHTIDHPGHTPAPTPHAELVEVFGEPLLDRREPGVAFDVSAGREDLQSLPGAAVGGAFRAVHTLAGVTSTDDFRNDFSVRGSPYRHVAFVIDGVSAPWLTHAAYGRGNSASVAMLGGESVETVTLHAGAYPRRDSDRLGAQLAVALREGSRERTALRGTVSATYVSLTSEGPLGHSGRGSWIAGLRNSHRDWPVSYTGQYDGTALGFTDAHAKLVYDVKPSQQFSFTMLGGRAGVDERDGRGAQELGDGINRAGLATLAWRSTIGRSAVLTQRASVMSHQFLNRDQTDTYVGSGTGRATAYRTDLVAALGSALFEIGGQAQHLTRSRSDGSARSSWEQFAYGHIAWSPAPGMTIAPGVRVATSTLTPTTVSPWLLTQWSFKRHWMMFVSTAVSHQSPDLDHAISSPPVSRIKAERALSVDLGVLARAGENVRFQATVYAREERNVIDALALAPTFGGLSRGAVGQQRDGTLMGSAYGMELSVDRRAQSRLSGWVSYSYGRARQNDSDTNETFWGDFDQRHAINVAAFHRFSPRTIVTVQFRAGTNFPIPGYLTRREGRLFVGTVRNAVRLPAYARLDVSAHRTLVLAGRSITIFAEVLNVLNRSNMGLANGVVNQHSGEATGFTKHLLGPLPGVGLTVRF